ncbi:MAG: HDIG domain-containing protein [Lentisphaerae bacterium]|nr:HDIG domain-containing protein [Lentisphaerota bacterium]
MTDIVSKVRQQRYRRASTTRARGRRPLGAPIPAGLVLWAGASLFLIGQAPVFHEAMVAGQRAAVTILASVEFECVDHAATQLRRQQAADSVLPVFTVNMGPAAVHLRAAGKLVRRVADLRTSNAPPASVQAELTGVIDLLGFGVAPEDALQLIPPGADGGKVLLAITNALRTVWAEGIIGERDRAGSIAQLARQGQVLLEPSEGGAARIADVASLRTPGEAAARFGALVTAALAPHPAAPDALRRLAESWMTPNLAYAPALTDLRRVESTGRIEPVRKTVRAGTTLIHAGETATAQTVEMLAAHERTLRERMTRVDEWIGYVGRAGLLALATFCGLALLQVVEPRHRIGHGRLALFVTLGLLTVGLSRAVYILVNAGVLPRALGDYLLPTGLGALLATLLAGRGFTIALGTWSALAVAVFAGNQFHVLFLGASVVLAASLSAGHTRKRAEVFRAGLWMGLAGAVFVVCATLLMRNPAAVVLSQGAAVLAAGLLTAILALLLLPAFEWAFGLTSDIRLLELSDPSHPLLERLAVEAPGTYHHSLMVANLAQTAADEIGADGLLARVSALYHDIGKLSTPRYFIENACGDRNPHDDLSPQMSTLVILSHVKEGAALARMHRLPPPIRDAIQQHHGTSLVTYFYRRAQETSEAGALRGPAAPTRPEERDFRYPGPRPRSREIAILALADAVEAASRTLHRPSAGRIASLVREVVRRRVAEGHVDESGLTLAELDRVRQAFVFTLTGMHHGRIPYPDHEDQHPESNGTERPDNGAPRTDGVSDDTRLVAERAESMG